MPVVRLFAGVRRRRSAGRTSTNSSTETTRKTAPSVQIGRSSSQLDPAAANAPPPSMSRNVSPVSASAPANPSATISQITAADMPSGYRVIGLGHGEQLDCETMWCPSATLSVWANAWPAGKAPPDDVLDALSCWAPSHSVTAYDAVAAGHTGLPWPDINDAGAVSLLQTLRTAAGRAATGTSSIRVALPVPGDVRGLAPGTQFERDALAGRRGGVGPAPHGPRPPPRTIPASPSGWSPNTAMTNPTTTNS